MGGKFITVGILISVFGCINGYVLTGSRILYTLGTQKTIPYSKYISKLNNNNVPANATIIMCILGALYATSGQFNLLSDLSMFAVWSFYVLTFLGVFKLRKERPDLHRPYKVPLYPVIPMIAIAGGLFVVVNQLLFSGFQNTIISFGGILITLVGLPIYDSMQKRAKKHEDNDIDKIA